MHTDDAGSNCELTANMQGSLGLIVQLDKPVENALPEHRHSHLPLHLHLHGLTA